MDRNAVANGVTWNDLRMTMGAGKYRGERAARSRGVEYGACRGGETARVVKGGALRGGSRRGRTCPNRGLAQETVGEYAAQQRVVGHLSDGGRH